MNEYLETLKGHLSQLSGAELDEVLDFYSEYLQDGGFTTYEQAVDELGTPKQVARKILADYSIKEGDQKAQTATGSRVDKPKNDVKTIWLIVLAILSTPITIPMAIVLFAFGGVAVAVSGAMVVGIVGVIFGFLFAAVMMLFAGVAVIASSTWTGVYYLGLGLLILGIFVIAIPVAKWFIELIFHWMSVFFKWVYSKTVTKNKAEKRADHK
ncbi:DUF1700 domain-containing protein [Lentilactobacillus sp. Marseille-Q4993]|uniref:DUF1700 domain-containing protein n=1 Tax=Lentilactobacillus sp. Marseille-Q4993 TaxID=3039492 RepID=UPI0024BCB54A|nr:DUF1700 domain-containing protein [Lentilactobacillus sp. Marseille-Q4993]